MSYYIYHSANNYVFHFTLSKKDLKIHVTKATSTRQLTLIQVESKNYSFIIKTSDLTNIEKYAEADKIISLNKNVE
ncbi:7353_t:CDS:1, partial [Racocetra persica]